MEAVIVQVIVAGGVLAALVVMWGLRSSIRPSIIERLERSMVSNQTRLDSQEAEIEDLWRQIHELREGRIADHALLQEWITYARRLASMFKEATGQEPPPEPTSCCGRGCNGCVWEGYFAAMAYWRDEALLQLGD